MMRILFGFVAVAALLGGSALAESRTYTIAGKTPAGVAYTGSVALDTVPDTGSSGEIVKVVYTFADGTQVQAVGMATELDKLRGNLTIAFPGGSGVPGVMVLESQSNGTLAGEWMDPATPTVGGEIWTPTGATAAAPADASADTAEADYNYDIAIRCAAATGYVVSALRATPGADAAAIQKYDESNTAWTLRLGDVAGDKTLDQRLEDIRVLQNGWAMDANGMEDATTTADGCVANPPPASN